MSSRFLALLICLGLFLPGLSVSAENSADSSRVVAIEAADLAEGSNLVPYGDPLVHTSDRRKVRSLVGEDALLGSKSCWEGDLTTQKQWLEVDWRFSTRVAGFRFNVEATPPCAGVEIECWIPGEERWEVFIQIENPSNVCVRTGHLETSKLRLVMDPGPTKRTVGMRVSDLEILGVDPLPVEPGWVGKWIWAPLEGATPSTAYFHHELVIEPGVQVESAWFFSAVDDDASIWVNGRALGRANGRTPQGLPMKNLLVPGTNVLAVSAVDRGGAYGFVADIILNLSKGTNRFSRVTGTDSSWRAIERDPVSSEWMKPIFDVRKWGVAEERFSPPPKGPWGEVPYTSFVKNDDRVKIRLVTDGGLKVIPGNQLEAVVELTPLTSLTRDYALVLDADTPYPVPTRVDLSVASVTVWPATATTAMQKGRTYRIPIKMQIGKWAPDGISNLSLTLVGEGAMADLVTEESQTEGLKQLGVGKLDIDRLPSPESAVTVQATIRPAGDRPALFLNDTPVPPLMFVPLNVGHSAMHAASQTGIHMYRISAFGNIITTPERQDELFAEYAKRLDADIDRVLRYDSDAVFFLAVVLRTDAAWTTKYPEECVKDGLGKADPSHSSASRQWRDDACALVKQLVRHVEAGAYGGHVIGYGFMAGGGGEFHHYGPRRPKMVDRDQRLLGDYSSAAQQAFRAWLREEYNGDVDALRKAWNASEATFESAFVPHQDLVASPEIGFFRDPVKARPVLDYWKWYSANNGGNLLAFCRAGKEASAGNPLCGGFYGYINKLANQTPGADQSEGHGAFPDILDAPELDFIALPYSYAHRLGGTPFAQNVMSSSLAARGKLFFAEIDNRTFASGFMDYPQHTLKETTAIQRRDIGAGLCTGDGGWWLDFSMGSRGKTAVPWFADPSVVKDMRQAYGLWGKTMDRGFKKSARIAVFADFKSSRHLDPYASIPGYNLMTRTLQTSVPAIGAPSDWYMLDDLKFKSVQEDYDVYLFLNSYRLSAEHRRIIRERLQRDGKTLVWLWASGFVSENGVSIEGMSEITGMTFERDDTWQSSEVELEPEWAFHNGGYQIKGFQMKDWDNGYFANRSFYEKRLAPVFWPTDQELEIGARFKANGHPALAVRRFDDWTSVYAGIPYLPAGVLRKIVKDAGVHVYTRSPVASLHAGNGFISIHNGSLPQPMAVSLPVRSDVVDAFTGEILAEDTMGVRLEMGKHDTRVLEVYEK